MFLDSFFKYCFKHPFDVIYLLCAISDTIYMLLIQKKYHQNTVKLRGKLAHGNRKWDEKANLRVQFKLEKSNIISLQIQESHPPVSAYRLSVHLFQVYDL